MTDPDGGAAGGDGTEERPALQRLDPDRAAGGQSPAPPPPDGQGSAPRSPDYRPPPPVIDVRPYRWAIGVIGLVLVIVFSVYQFVTHGVTTTGVPVGQRLHLFAAPLADTTLDGDPNAHPACTAARHDPRALNICLLVQHAPLVLAFYVNGASQCERQVDALQTLSARFPSVQFAAVAVGGSHGATAAVVRHRHWTIPVAYDADGVVQQLYGVVACPMVELAGRGGVVRARLIGNRWQTVAALEPYVRELAAAAGPAPPA